jgi:hypothetical protein
LLGVLSVFPADFDLEAVEAIAEPSEAGAAATLQRLFKHSLVEYDEHTRRYSA